MKLGPVCGTALLLALATSLTVSLIGQSTSPAASAENPTKRAAHSKDVSAGKRKIPCKTPENASLCYWTHGRLSVYNGNPSLRIWKIGANRVLGVYNGPSHSPPHTNDDDENPELPSRLDRAYVVDRRRWEKEGNSSYGPPDIFADFEICPLEPEKPGWMQAVCIESATKVFVDKAWR